MPLDPMKPAVSMLARTDTERLMIAQSQETSRCPIEDIPSGKALTVLAIQTPVAFTPQQFMEVMVYLQTNYGVEAAQTTHFAVTPDYGPENQIDLHLALNLVGRKRDIVETETE